MEEYYCPVCKKKIDYDKIIWVRFSVSEFKESRCPNCNVELILYPYGVPDVIFEIPYGVLYRKPPPESYDVEIEIVDKENNQKG